MDSAKLNDWLQVIGLFGVIASLIFVGLQMKQEHEIALSNAYQARADTATQLWSDMASNPALVEATIKSEDLGYDSLSRMEKAVLAYSEQAWLHVFENIHFQYINGFISEEHWRRSREAFKSDFRTVGTRSLYERNPGMWRESFQQAINDLIAEIDAESHAGSEQRSDPQ
jgi:hypothetical protein